jgi:diaminohydroxyphosphoribosylaminopyrimidine deaminase/5-amino-6-(5-phosphoribosylamino)uracil reductase
MSAAAAPDDRAWMARALELARRGLYSTPPNPAVGCVLVRDGEAVGEGWHERAGEPHAEVMALRAAGERARGADAYVTLEPCSHQGRTGPCVDALLQAGVRRVVAAMRDPNPHVNGQGLERLERAGVTTVSGVLEDEARDINRGFIARMTRSRPWVTLKMASSLDGRAALADGRSQWITGEEARADVQRLRARASAIVTGIGTVLADDPRLTVRDPALELRGRRPLRVVLDAALRVPLDAQLLATDAPTLVITAAEFVNGRQAEALRSRGATVESIASSDGHLDLRVLMARLAALECGEVLVESGPTVAGAFVTADLVDELVLYCAPTLLGHTARASFELAPLQSLDMKPGFDFRGVAPVGRDVRLTLRPRRRPG